MSILKRVVLRAPATVVHAAAFALGGVIPLPAEVSYATLNLDYTNGDETSIAVWPTFLDMMGGIESRWMSWTAAAGNKTFTTNALVLNATGTANYTFDVTGFAHMRFFELAVGGTPTGVLTATLTLKGA